MLTIATMGKELGEAIRKARKSKRLTLTALAEQLGVSYPAVQQWEVGKTDPSTENLLKVSRLLGVDFLKFEPADAESESVVPLPSPNVDFSKAEDAPPLHMFGGPRNIEVKGTAVGGSGGDFEFNGDTIDRVPRPPGIANREGVYALYVESDSMYPRFNPGRRLYVDPHRKPQPGDDVIVEMYPEEDGVAGQGFIKTLVKRTQSKLIVEQFNPPKQIEFDLTRVKTLHRVIPVDELLGV